MDTLISQAFGAGEHRQIGIILQRGLFINLVFTMTVLPVVLFPRRVLRLLLSTETDMESVLAVATTYSRFYSFSLLPVAVFDTLRRYLICQNIVEPMIWSSATALAVNICLHVVLVSIMRLDAVGSAISLVVANLANLGVCLLLSVGRGLHRKTWFGWTAEALADLRSYLALSIPGVLQVCAEWWSFEVTVFVVARVGQNALAAHVILMNLCFLDYLAPMSFGTAAAVRVGNALGAGQADDARRSMAVAIGVGLITATTEATLLYAFRGIWPRIYTSNIKISEFVSSLAGIFALFTIADNIQAVLGGVLRGSGKQALGAYGNVVAFWLIGLPLGAWLCLRGDREPLVALQGLWGGLAAGEALLVIVIVTLVCAIDWRAQVRLAMRRVGQYQPIA